MVIVPIGRQFKELGWKGVSAKSENILMLQNYMESMHPEVKEAVPVGISDTVKDKIGISKIEFFMDENGKMYVKEINQGQKNLIEFSGVDNIRRIY